MRNVLLVPEILEALEEQRHEDLVAVLSDLHPKDAASILSGLDEDKIAAVLDLLPNDLERDVFGYFDPEDQERILLGTGREHIQALLGAMLSDDRAAFLERLDLRVREQMMPLLTKAAREDLLRREQYRPDQVGSLLSTEYSVLDAGMTARAAIEEIRRQAPRKETIYYSYVVDTTGRLIGLVSLRKLIVAPGERHVHDIMVTDVVSVRADDDREHAAQMIRQYDLLAIPVTDEQHRLIGILTHDDAADIIQEEAAEDLEKMAGIAADEGPEHYLDTTIATQFRRRIPVLTVLAISYVITGGVIRSFDQLLSRGPQVVIALLPMILSTGGNVGNQTSTAVLLGLREGVAPGALLAVLWKELRVGLCLAAVLATIAGLETYYLLDPAHASPLRICSAVAVAMTMHVLIASTLGAAIPLSIAALGRDPAMIANPALATIADLSGALIYLLTIQSMVTF